MFTMTDTTAGGVKPPSAAASIPCTRTRVPACCPVRLLVLHFGGPAVACNLAIANAEKRKRAQSSLISTDPPLNPCVCLNIMPERFLLAVQPLAWASHLFSTPHVRFSLPCGGLGPSSSCGASSLLDPFVWEGCSTRTQAGRQ